MSNLQDPTINLWFSHLTAFKALVGEKEDEDLVRVIEEIIEEERAQDED